MKKNREINRRKTTQSDIKKRKSTMRFKSYKSCVFYDENHYMYKALPYAKYDYDNYSENSFA